MKKIIFLADIVPFPPNTGIKIRTYNIIKQLSKKYKILLLAFNHKVMISDTHEREKCINALQDVCEKVYVFEIPSDRSKFSYICCLLKNLFQISPYRVKRYYSQECIEVINEIVNNQKIDLVHFDKTEFYGYSKLFKGIPMFATNHNIESKLMWRRSKFEINIPRKVFAYLQYLKTRRFEGIALRRVDGFITCTDLDMNYFKDELNIQTPCKVIPNGADLKKYTPRGLGDGDYILIIGAQNKESTANYDATCFFIRNIWPKVQDGNSKIKLKIVGRNPDKNIIDIEKQFNNVEVCGYVEDERKMIERALALIVPLRVGGGSRLKILTAMALETVVISTTIGAEGISCSNGTNIIIEDDPVLFARSILSIVGQSDTRKKIGSEARLLVEEHYDWDRIGVELIDFYEKVVRCRNG